jgi:hypothetical protein
MGWIGLDMKYFYSSASQQLSWFGPSNNPLTHSREKPDQAQFVCSEDLDDGDKGTRLPFTTNHLPFYNLL